jgi:hypothetical protein
MKVYLLPIISPSKYVVKLGWSSVRPAAASVLYLALSRARLLTLDAQISAHKRLAHIDMFHLDLDFVLLAI